MTSPSPTLAETFECVYMFRMSANLRSKTLLIALASLAAAIGVPVAAHAAELLMFKRDGCVWCARWDREIAPIYEKADEAKLLPLRRVDLDRDKPAGITLASPVIYTPTFVVIDDGREVGRIIGYINDDQFWGLLGQLAAKLRPATAPTPARI